MEISCNVFVCLIEALILELNPVDTFFVWLTIPTFGRFAPSTSTIVMKLRVMGALAAAGNGAALSSVLDCVVTSGSSVDVETDVVLDLEQLQIRNARIENKLFLVNMRRRMEGVAELLDEKQFCRVRQQRCGAQICRAPTGWRVHGSRNAIRLIHFSYRTEDT